MAIPSQQVKTEENKVSNEKLTTLVWMAKTVNVRQLHWGAKYITTGFSTRL